MKKFGLAAIIALTSTAAFAGSFEIPVNGGVARIRIDENCRDSLCASVSWQERGGRGERREFTLPKISVKSISKLIDSPRWGSIADDDDETDGPAPKQTPSAPTPQTQRQPSPSTPSAAVAPAPSATVEPKTSAVTPDPSDPAPSYAPAPSAPVEPRVAAVAPQPEPAPAQTQQASRTSPVGEWLVEDGEGRIRIEECGANLCGYVTAAKNPNDKDRKNPDPSLRSRSVIGMPVLIDMKPAGNRWKGNIYNVKDGGTYSANISMKGEDKLRVEGCAFGGMICGGQSWSRVN
jgi:uncharacterized protein (DUF2147 family)